MSAIASLLELLRTSDMFLMLGHQAPLLRLNCALRSAVEVPHLHNVLWGRECGHCIRAKCVTWVFTEDNDEGQPIIYLCVLCAHRVRLWDHEDDEAEALAN